MVSVGPSPQTSTDEIRPQSFRQVLRSFLHKKCQSAERWIHTLPVLSPAPQRDYWGGFTMLTRTSCVVGQLQPASCLRRFRSRSTCSTSSQGFLFVAKANVHSGRDSNGFTERSIQYSPVFSGKWSFCGLAMKPRYKHEHAWFLK